jgi:hypothetical protein
MISITLTYRPVMYVLAHIYLLVMTGYCRQQEGRAVVAAGVPWRFGIDTLLQFLPMLVLNLR